MRYSADVNQGATHSGGTAIMEAAEQGRLDIARLLLDRSADPNQARTDGGHTALMGAAQGGHLEAARLLLDRSAGPNQARTDDGHTALMCAADNGRLEVARLLLDRSADPNQARTDDGYTALMLAAQAGHLKSVLLLVVYRANTAAVDNDGETACDAALNNGHQTIADCLKAIEGWPVFKIAAACRFHADVRAMLRRGTIDPAACPRADITTAITFPANTLWRGSPAPCPATTALVNAALSSWSPGRHFLYHPGVRSSIHTVLLGAERLRRRHGAQSGARRSTRRLQVLPAGMPNELWCIVCSFFRRADWPA